MDCMLVIIFIGADDRFGDGWVRYGVWLTSSNPGPSIVIGCCEFDIDCEAGCDGGRGCRTPFPFCIPLGVWTG